MSLSPEIQQQRYAAIELAYSERRWPEVEQLSQDLLAEVPANPADPLRLRLELLLGHTRLYGLGDSSAARQHYACVLAHGTEATLRDIAQQSLDQCEQLERPSQGDPSPVAEAPLLAEIVEEPEQIAVALADPQRRQELELEERLVIQPSNSAGPVDPLHFDPSQLSPGELEELSKGLLLLSLH